MMRRQRHKILQPTPSSWPVPGAGLDLIFDPGSGQRIVVQAIQVGAVPNYLLAFVQPGGPPGAVPLQIQVGTPELQAQACTVGFPIPDGWDRVVFSLPVAAGPLQGLNLFIIDPDGGC